MSYKDRVGLAPYPEEKLVSEMWEDRFFVPNSGIHGVWTKLIRVYLNNSHGESKRYNDHNQWEYDEISCYLIRDAYKEDPSLGDDFDTIINENLQNFCVISTDALFRDIIEEWPNAISMTRQDMVDWAMGVYKGETVKIVDSYEHIDNEDTGIVYVCQLGDDIRINIRGINVPNSDNMFYYPLSRDNGCLFYKESEPDEKVFDLICVAAVLEVVQKYCTEKEAK